MCVYVDKGPVPFIPRNSDFVLEVELDLTGCDFLDFVEDLRFSTFRQLLLFDC